MMISSLKWEEPNLKDEISTSAGHLRLRDLGILVLGIWSPARRVLIGVRRGRGFLEAAAGLDGAAQADELVCENFQIAEGRRPFF
jgi:hypothetical protein